MNGNRPKRPNEGCGCRRRSASIRSRRSTDTPGVGFSPQFSSFMNRGCLISRSVQADNPNHYKHPTNATYGRDPQGCALTMLESSDLSHKDASTMTTDSSRSCKSCTSSVRPSTILPKKFSLVRKETNCENELISQGIVRRVSDDPSSVSSCPVYSNNKDTSTRNPRWVLWDAAETSTTTCQSSNEPYF